MKIPFKIPKKKPTTSNTSQLMVELKRSRKAVMMDSLCLNAIWMTVVPSLTVAYSKRPLYNKLRDGLAADKNILCLKILTIYRKLQN
jgi:hypothetical protein